MAGKNESSKKPRRSSESLSSESSRVRKESEGDTTPPTTPPLCEPPEPEQLIEALQVTYLGALIGLVASQERKPWEHDAVILFESLSCC